MIENKFDKTAAEKISNYIKNNSVETTRKGDIVVDWSKITQKLAHKLPRGLFKIEC